MSSFEGTYFVNILYIKYTHQNFLYFLLRHIFAHKSIFNFFIFEGFLVSFFFIKSKHIIDKLVGFKVHIINLPDLSIQNDSEINLIWQMILNLTSSLLVTSALVNMGEGKEVFSCSLIFQIKVSDICSMYHKLDNQICSGPRVRYGVRTKRPQISPNSIPGILMATFEGVTFKPNCLFIVCPFEQVFDSKTQISKYSDD